MQFFKIRENASGEIRNESGRVSPDGGLVIGGYPRRQWVSIFLAVLLVHGALIAYLKHTSVAEIPAEPLVMEAELLTAAAPRAAEPAPPAPPAVQPKPQPKPVKPKKAPAPPKKPQVVRKPVPAPAPKPASVAPPVPMSAAQAASSTPGNPTSPAAAAASTAAPAASASAKAVPFTEANYRANYKSNPKPEYPRIAKSRGWQGKVLLRVDVTVEGRSAAVAVQQSSGHDLLDEAAVEAVRRWTFLPAKRGDTPVASTVTVPIQFKLND
jgi:protein TonB